MHIRTSPILRAVVCAAILTVPSFAAPQSGEEPTPTSEVQRVAGSLEGLEKRIDALQARVRVTLGQAKQAKSPDEELALMRDVIAIGAELERMLAAFTADVDFLKLATNPIKAKITEAMRLPTLKDAKAEIEKIETDVAKAAADGGADAQRILGFAHYQLADILRQIATQELGGTKDDRSAATTMERAIKKYNDVLGCPDSAVTEIGSSLHAVALRKVVQCESSLCFGYKRLLEISPSPTNQAKFKQHREAAAAALERLNRVYPGETMADGQNVAETARKDIERIRGQ